MVLTLIGDYMSYNLAPSIHEMNYRVAMTVVENQRAEIAALKAQLVSLCNNFLGWAILDKDDVIRDVRAKLHGLGFENGPYTQEDVIRNDRDWAGCAPHRVVVLIGIPYEETSNRSR